MLHMQGHHREAQEALKSEAEILKHHDLARVMTVLTKCLLFEIYAKGTPRSSFKMIKTG